MDYRAALDVLGLTDGPELTRDQVRRTYLRKLREHPPERDPEGFKRLREAYEALRHLPDPAEREQIAQILAQAAERKPPEREDEPDAAVSVDSADDEDAEAGEESELDVQFFMSSLAPKLEEILSLLEAGESRTTRVGLAVRLPRHAWQRGARGRATVTSCDSR